MLNKTQNKILNLFRNFERMNYSTNKINTFVDAMFLVNDFSKKYPAKHQWVKEIKKTYTRAFFQHSSENIKRMFLSQNEPEQKRTSEFINKNGDIFDQEYFEDLLIREQKKI